MKKIRVPDDVEMRDPLSGETTTAPKQTFSTFIVGTALNDKSFGESFQTLKAATKLEALFKDCKPGDEISVEDADYEKLRAAVDRPSGGYNPLFARLVFSFLDAVMSAE